MGGDALVGVNGWDYREWTRDVRCPQCGGEFDRYRVIGALGDDGTWFCSQRCRDLMEDGDEEMRDWSVTVTESPAFFAAVADAASEHRCRSELVAIALREWLEDNGYLETWE